MRALRGPGCRIAELELRSGPDAGERTFLVLAGDRFAPPVEAGDELRVARNTRGETGEDPPLDDPSQYPVAFVDFERSRPLLVLAFAFVALVIVLGRWHGVRALLGLGLSLALVVEFLAPAILDDPPAGPDGAGRRARGDGRRRSCSRTGRGSKSLAAMLGTAGALLLTTVLAVFAVRGADVTGLSSEQATLLLAGVEGRSRCRGSCVAGIVIGALGVLDDVTVVAGLDRAGAAAREPGARLPAPARRGAGGRPRPPRRDRQHAGARLRRRGPAGAADLQHGGHAVRHAVNREPVAEQIVAMLVGSIGLIAAVPLTTAIAALLASRLPAAAVPAEHVGHAH